MNSATEIDLHAIPSVEAEPVQTVPAPPAHGPQHRHSLLQSFQSLITLIIIALFIITFTFQPFRIPSESMVPTLLVGDFLLVNKEVSRDPWLPLVAPTHQIHRGDLIVFHYPVDSSLHLVKRVIALPGERVRLHAGRAYINGVPLNEPYAIFQPAEHDSYRDDFPRMGSPDPDVDSRWWIQLRSLVSDGEITVPPDSFFVLGDNRNDSEDSRYWGFVPRAAIVGKPFLIYFSVRTPDNTPADSRLQRSAHEPPGKLGSVVAFARWDRAMHVIH
ncbi:MAG TPA: signal peptidase I [Acidobacteriaceae bacterium]|jgi:signal peptidase I|nr:signal peptidase I [Acidobacteriaceae bacterium]